MSASERTPRPIARSAATILLLAAASATAGCYVYQPVVTRDRPAPGQDVRITYQDPAAAGVETEAWQRGAVRPVNIQGRVIEWGEDAVVLGVFPPPTAGGMSRASPHPDTLRVPVPGILTIEARTLSRGRTAAFAIGGTAVGALIVRTLMRWTRSAGTAGGTS